MQILPSKELLPFIKHYLFLENEGKSIKKLRLFSDGNTGIVFSFRGHLIADAPSNTPLNTLPNAFVYGQISAFKDLYLAGETALIIVVFQPSGVHQLLGIPADELRDTIVSTEDVFGLQALELQEKLLGKNDCQNKPTLLNAFFTQLMPKNAFNSHILIQSSLHFILKNKGCVSVNQLVKHTGYTERHIERMFSDAVGLNPKKFSNIIRLHTFLRLMKEGTGNFTTIGYKCGYADQSHLIREFKKYTGITPKEYVNDTRKLAVNFMALNK